MKKHASLVSLIVAVLALLIFCLWYTAPRTAEELFSGFRWSEADSISGTYTFYTANDPGKAPINNFGATDEFQAGSDPFNSMLSLLRDLEYRRSLRNLLPSGTRTHLIHPGDLNAAAQVSSEKGIFTVQFWFEHVYVYYDGQKYRCSIDQQQETAAALLALLQANATETDIYAR